ncbi:MAG: ABC transporter permease [Propionibacteriaceae bacterium]|jgi:ABC-2 type transport system permease protein|nr:ABC transporter permease [Propionibacteriaceae bacterium]
MTVDASPDPRAHLSFWGVLASERIKFLSLRSTYWVLGVFIFVTTGVNALIYVAMKSADGVSGLDLSVLLADLHLTQLMNSGVVIFGKLIIAILGVLMVTNEYSSGMIRSTLTAAPRRVGVIAGKCVVLIAAAVATGSLAAAFSYLIGLAMFSDTPLDVSLFQGQNLRIVLGLQLYVATLAVLGCLIGLLIRSTAASIATIVCLTFVLPTVAETVSGFLSISGSGEGGWRRVLLGAFECLPTTAGDHLFDWVGEVGDSAQSSAVLGLGPWTGYGVLCLWVLAFAIPAFLRLLRRDV